MKTHAAWLVMVVLLVGCDARTAVLRDKVLAKIDVLLGELDVKRKSVELGIVGLKDSRDTLTKGKIGLEVKAEQLEAELAVKKRKLADTDRSLGRLREQIKAGQPVTLAGKKYSVEDLNTAAQEILAGRRSLENSIAAIQRAEASLRQRAAQLAKMLVGYDQRLGELENKITEMDASAMALRALKDTSRTVGDDGQSLADHFAGVEAQVNSLCATIQTELRFEDARWEATTTETLIQAVDSAGSAKPEAGLISEIDQALKTKEGQ